MGRRPRSFAADAYDCIMVLSSRIDRMQGCGADLRAPIASSPSDAIVSIFRLRDTITQYDERKFYKIEIHRRSDGPDEIRASRQRLWQLGLRIRGQAPRLRRAARGFRAFTAQRNRSKRACHAPCNLVTRPK